MITQIVFVVMFIVLTRLAFDSYRRGSFGFQKIEFGFEVAVVGSIIALFLFGLLDSIGVLSVFSYEIYQKIRKQQLGE
jgi:hypothetical protein